MFASMFDTEIRFHMMSDKRSWKIEWNILTKWMFRETKTTNDNIVQVEEVNPSMFQFFRSEV